MYSQKRQKVMSHRKLKVVKSELTDYHQKVTLQMIDIFLLRRYPTLIVVGELTHSKSSNQQSIRNEEIPQ